MSILNRKNAEAIFRLSQKELLYLLEKYLVSIYSEKNIIKTSSYVCAKGDIPIGLVAHLDTVFPHPPKEIFFDSGSAVFWSPDGLGADDRAGVIAILNILEQGFRPSLFFVTDEEAGCEGAFELITEYPECPFDIKYLIELDRRGGHSCVFYDCFNKKFQLYVRSFDFITAHGSYSDISVLCPTWNIAGVNLSVGYYNEHSYREFLRLDELQLTIQKVIKMLEAHEGAKYFAYEE